jgi:ABC-2 type transport system permease protein
MSEQTRTTGNIYDLGYRSYEGERYGRPYAIFSLYVYSFKTIFGLGRSWLSKLFPIGLAVIALIPSIVQLAVAAVSPLDVTFIRPEEYFGFVSIVLALFCAVSAPEIIGRDQRTRTLSLYFSRALSRLDYLFAKLLALALALLLVLVTPQMILILGKAVAATDLVDSLRTNANELPAILASSLLAALLMSSVSLAIAAQTSRRAFSTGAVLGYFVVLSALGSIFVATLGSDVRGYGLLVSPIGVIEGAVHWIFHVAPQPDSDLAKADLNGAIYALVSFAYIAAGTTVLVRRIMRIEA